MTDKTNRDNPDEARAALDSIHDAQNTGMSRVVPPRWFGIAISVSGGAIMAAMAAGETQMIAVGIAIMVSAMAYRSRTAGARPREMPQTILGFFALILLIAFALAVAYGARVLEETQGFAWAPLAAGGVIAITIYCLSLLERRAYCKLVNTSEST